MPIRTNLCDRFFKKTILAEAISRSLYWEALSTVTGVGRECDIEDVIIGDVKELFQCLNHYGSVKNLFNASIRRFKLAESYDKKYHQCMYSINNNSILEEGIRECGSCIE